MRSLLTTSEGPVSIRHRLIASALLAVGSFAPTILHAQIDSGRVPLQTAISEIFRLRESYAETYNAKDVAGLMEKYDENATAILPNGMVVTGRAAIAKSMGNPAELPHMVITSDSLAVWGNTAVDRGTVKQHPAAGGEIVSRYLVVLRRGMKEWKLVYAVNVPVGDGDD